MESVASECELGGGASIFGAAFFTFEVDQELLISAQFQLKAFAVGRRLAAAAAFMGWGTIVTLSMVPGSERPHTGASGFSEHFAAYFIVALCGAHAWRRLNSRLTWGIFLTGTAAVMEVLQLGIPGRNAEVSGAISAAAGAWSAIVGSQAVAVARQFLKRG